MTWLGARWALLDPAARRAVQWLLLGGLVVAVAVVAAFNPWLLLVGPFLFALFFLGGIVSALVEIRRDRRTARERVAL